MDMETRKQLIERRIASAARRCGRDPATIQILAVSKTQTAERVRESVELGQLRFGENYLQEATAKIAALDDLQIEWHYIGQLQRNKTQAVADLFDWVQSVDRTILADRLSAQRPPGRGPLNVCLQVHLSDEPGKGGVNPAELADLARHVAALPNLRLRGLMSIPEHTTDTHRQRQAFATLARLFRGLQADYPDMDTLSMGMSGDFELAIEEGATLLRIGTALFGERRRST